MDDAAVVFRQLFIADALLGGAIWRTVKRRQEQKPFFWLAVDTFGSLYAYQTEPFWIENFAWWSSGTSSTYIANVCHLLSADQKEKYNQLHVRIETI